MDFSIQLCHILANALKRPICLFDGRKEGSRGGTFLPLRRDPGECFRHPLAMAWSSNTHDWVVPLMRTRQGVAPVVIKDLQPPVLNSTKAEEDFIRYIALDGNSSFTIGDGTSLKDVPLAHPIWSLGDFVPLPEAAIEQLVAQRMAETDAQRAVIFSQNLFEVQSLESAVRFHVECVIENRNGYSSIRADNFLQSLIVSLETKCAVEIDTEAARWRSLHQRREECVGEKGTNDGSFFEGIYEEFAAILGAGVGREETAPTQHPDAMPRFRSLISVAQLLAIVFGDVLMHSSSPKIYISQAEMLLESISGPTSPRIFQVTHRVSTQLNYNIIHCLLILLALSELIKQTHV